MDDQAGVILGGFDAFDIRKRLYQGSLHGGSGALFKGIENVIYRYIRTVVELHVVPQGEGVSQLVIGQLIILGNRRVEVASAVCFDQAFIDIE